MAQVHSLQVPVRKALEPLVAVMRGNIEEAYEDGRMNLVEKLDLKTLALVDIRKEFETLMGILLKANIKVVYCHCDFRSSNV